MCDVYQHYVLQPAHHTGKRNIEEIVEKFERDFVMLLFPNKFCNVPFMLFHSEM